MASKTNLEQDMMKPKTKIRSSVTIQCRDFGLYFEKTNMTLSASPEFMQKIAQGVIPEEGSLAQQIFLMQYLNLSEQVCDMLEETCAREGLTFAEAMNHHLRISLSA